MIINRLIYIKALIISGVLLSSGLMAQADDANAIVSVQVNQELYQFSSSPRLVDILAPVALVDNWYWPASALYKTDDNSAHVLQQRVLQQLADLQQKYATDTKLQQALLSMVSQVQSWQLATRVFIPIDYDFARARAALNPKFTPGNYRLQIYTRPAQITLLGLVSNHGKIGHKNAGNVAQYVAEMSPLAAADTNTLYLIQPDGRIVKVTAAAWQQNTIEAMPGAQLFVPFKTGLLSAKWQRLNQDIVALARHRVLL